MKCRSEITDSFPNFFGTKIDGVGGNNLENMIFKIIIQNNILGIRSEMSLMCMRQNLTATLLHWFK